MFDYLLNLEIQLIFFHLQLHLLLTHLLRAVDLHQAADLLPLLVDHPQLLL